VLCGLRIGATLATLVASQRSDIAGLVLLAPVLRGRSFIRELRTEAAVRGGRPGVEAGREDALAIDELVLTGETVSLLQRVDLRTVELGRDRKVAVFAQSPSPVLSDCVAAWTSGGADVICEDFSGLEPMLRGAHLSHEPSAETHRILDWVRCKIPVGPPPRRHARAPERAEIRTVSYIETPLRFGLNGEMFGILCRPATDFEEGFVIVIVNSGGNPHQGVARSNVDLARKFAAHGFASLRMDFTGLGDSVAPEDPETHVFETDRRAEVATAIDELENLGYRRFAIHGLCSGAYHAFHAAVTDPRLEAVLLVNIPLLQWRNGDAIEFLSQIQEGPIKLALQLRQRTAWLRLLEQGLPGLRTRLTMQGAIIARKFDEFTRRVLGFDAPTTVLQENFRRLSRHARTLCLFGEGDLGIKSVGRELERNNIAQGFEVRIVSGLDHALTKSAMRGIVVKHMVEFLKSDARSEMKSPMLELSSSE
jgi:pimeloyl-ACP methyl ester carboxylesterase